MKKRLVIFGATSAISQAFVNRVASDFSSVVLIARNAENLRHVAQHLKVISSAAVTTIVADLADITTHESLVYGACASDTDCALVCYGELTDQDRCLIDPNYAMEQFELNALSTISLSARIAVLLGERQAGTLAVVVSVAGDRGRGSNYYYGAAKSAVATFLSGLRTEMASGGVQVLTIKPGFVDTPMTRKFKKGLLWSTPDRVAADIDQAIKKQQSVLYTPWFWRYIMLVIKLLPEFIFKRLSI